MRISVLPLLLSTLWVIAAERYTSADDPSSVVNSFARAAKINELQATSEGELRVWFRDYMTGSIWGYVITKSRTTICRMGSTYDNGVVTLGSPTCHQSSKGQAARSAGEYLPTFTRSEWDCPVDDGGEVFLEHVHAGRRSVVRVGNPSVCKDSESKMISALLRKLP